MPPTDTDDELAQYWLCMVFIWSARFGKSPATIADDLIRADCPAPGGGVWTLELVEELLTSGSAERAFDASLAATAALGRAAAGR